VTLRDRRALIAGGAVVGLAILILKLGPWAWQTVIEQRTELQARAELLERMRADVRSAARLEDSGVVVKGRLAMLAPKLLTGRTTSEATADLGARLAAAAVRHRVRVSRTDPVIDSTERRGIGPVALRAVLESDTRGLFGLLEAVGREPAVLVIDSLRITVADPLVPADRAELLRTDLTVSGWFLSAKDPR
jgi:hypothetical protein